MEAGPADAPEGQGMPLPLARRRLGGRAAWTWAVSIGVHVAGIVAFGGWALGGHPATPAAPDVEHLVAVDLPSMTESSLAATAVDEAVRDPVGEAPRLSGGATVARVDTGRDGHGGDPTVDRAARHLADVDEQLRFTTGTLNRLDRDQVPRVRSSAVRSAMEDRRSSREPMELAFLSQGDLDRLERRAVDPRDPSRGVLASRPASLQGGAVGVATDVGFGVAGEAGAEHEGLRTSEPGHGVSDGRVGRDHRAAAAVARARPEVAYAAVSVEALAKAKPADDIDSEQELAGKVEALVHASTAGGTVAASGRGGEGGGGAAGALGIVGAGSHPAPLGDGASDWFDVSSTDPRVVAYFRKFKAKVDPLWANAFPRSAMLELKQGTVILEVTIAADGTAHVAWPPARPSGIDEFDRNCAEAVRKASPFDPIPPALGLTTLHLRAPFVATNPIVR
jgi:TonB family protein